MKAVAQLLRRPDFRRNPAKAAWRRLFWRLRWALNPAPWALSLGPDLRITVPRCGAGALIYYQGYSDPDTAAFIQRFLKPGMSFLDIGAHLGEYTLLAAQAVGPQGSVHAFEPNPDLFRFLTSNATDNNLRNVTANPQAVGDIDGEAEFEVHPEPALSALAPRSGDSPRRNECKPIRVPVVRLDTYWAGCGRPPNLVKIDVEGAELQVFRGAKRLLACAEAPVWIFEFAPWNYARFQCRPADVRDCLEGSGYRIWTFTAQGELTPTAMDADPTDSINLVAAKDEQSVRMLLRAGTPNTG